MSRKKFRVWDLPEKKFYYSNKGYQGHYVISLDGNFTNLQNGAGGQEVIVQQYIGLKDSAGEDIYEGDLVEFDDSLYNDQCVKGVAEVIFTTDLSVVDAPSYGLWFKNGFHKNMLGSIKVVGNVFENRELASFDKALQDVAQGKVVPLDQALNEEPPSKELQKIFDNIEQMDAEREAWKKMFDMQTKLVTNAEFDKYKLEKEIESLKKEVQMHKDIVRLSKHIEEERFKSLKKENETLQGYLDNINQNLKTMTGEA